jgi:hypothetical protein
MFWNFWYKKNDLSKYSSIENYTKIILIQSIYRMYVERKKYLRKRKILVNIQQKYREKRNKRRETVELIVKNMINDISKKTEEKMIKSPLENVIIVPKKNINVRKRKIYKKYLNINDEFINIPEYRKDFSNYLNSNYDYNYIKKYKKYDCSIDCIDVLRSSMKNISQNLCLLKNCFTFDIEKNKVNLKRQKRSNKYYSSKYGTFATNDELKNII